jgi:RNA polymerase sigma-70 factor (ECF subfamily)
MLKIKHHSYAEVEEKLGISKTMVFKYLTKAMAHCRLRLSDFE